MKNIEVSEKHAGHLQDDKYIETWFDYASTVAILLCNSPSIKYGK